MIVEIVAKYYATDGGTITEWPLPGSVYKTEEKITSP